MKHDFKDFSGRPAVERSETVQGRKRFMSANEAKAMFCSFGLNISVV
jgi:hypothetical protein